jgi:hypothetical protein
MAVLSIGDSFPAARLQETNQEAVEFPAVFANAPATVIFFYRGRW